VPFPTAAESHGILKELKPGAFCLSDVNKAGADFAVFKRSIAG